MWLRGNWWLLADLELNRMLRYGVKRHVADKRCGQTLRPNSGAAHWIATRTNPPEAGKGCQGSGRSLQVELHGPCWPPRPVMGNFWAAGVVNKLFRGTREIYTSAGLNTKEETYRITSANSMLGRYESVNTVLLQVMDIVSGHPPIAGYMVDVRDSTNDGLLVECEETNAIAIFRRVRISPLCLRGQDGTILANNSG